MEEIELNRKAKGERVAYREFLILTLGINTRQL